MPELLPDREWLWIAAGLYTAAFLWVTYMMVRRRPRPRGWLLVIVTAGLAAQTMGLQQRGLEAGGCPLRNTFEVLQFVIWSFTVLYIVVGPAFRVSLLGYFTSGLAAVLSVTSLLVRHWDADAGSPFFGGDPWIEVHGSLALFAYGAFGTLALTSLMFLLQTFSLKRKRMRGVFGFLPSIVELETINYRLLLTGLAVLSFAVLVGAIYFGRAPDSIGVGKLLIASGVWLAYLCVLVLRVRRVLVANSLAWTCLALFAIALLSLPIVNSDMKRNAIEGGHPAAELASSVAPAVMQR